MNDQEVFLPNDCLVLILGWHSCWRSNPSQEKVSKSAEDKATPDLIRAPAAKLEATLSESSFVFDRWSFLHVFGVMRCTPVRMVCCFIIPARFKVSETSWAAQMAKRKDRPKIDFDHPPKQLTSTEGCEGVSK